MKKKLIPARGKDPFAYKQLLLVMKVTVFLVIFFVATGLANTGRSQETRLTVQLKNASLGEILNTIENNSSYYFMFNNQLIDLSKRMNIDVQNKTINEVLALLFERSGINYKIYNRQVVLSPESQSVAGFAMQQHTAVSGRVSDSGGQPLPGVTVVVKNTSTGTITDIDGRYALSNIPGNATLVFSFVGMQTQEILVSGKQVVDIILQEETIGLNEVVAVGYGVMRKKDVTGAMSSINVTKVDRSTIKSVDQMLQGRSAGLHMVQSSGMPGAGSTIRIRGGNSISGGNEPLYVIDGIPIYPSSTGSQTDIGTLNSIAITDIESIEVLKDASSTAIYGARGSNGVILITTKQGKAGRTNVSFDAYYGLQNIRKKYDLLNAKEFEEFVNDAEVRGGGNAVYDLTKEPVNTDWQELVTKDNAPIQNYNVSVSGGDEKTKFLLSLNYINQEGIIRKTEMEKTTLRVNLEREISSVVKTGLNMSMAQVNTNRTGNSVLGYRTLHPNIPVKDEYGNYNSLTMLGDVFTNPMIVLRDQINDNERFRTITNLFAEWEILKALRFKTNFGVDLSFANQNSYTPISTPSGSETGGDATITNNKDYMWVNENILTYVNTFGKHHFNGMVALTQQSSRYQGSQAESQGFLNDNLQMWDMASGTLAITPTSGSNRWSLLSYLGRINYSYDDRYLFTASFRADGSSRFGKNNRWGYFPSAAIAWRASEEEFIKNLGIFSNLKLRSSYGWTGNQDGIGVYPSMALLGKRAYSFGDVKYMGYYPSQVANYDLKWETTKQTDLGIEAGFMNNKLNISADFYYKATHDLLLNVQIPSTSGYTTGLKNIGKVENKGVEITVNASPFNKAFKWDVDFNITFNKNEVVSLGEVNEMVPTWNNASETDYGLNKSRLLRVGEPLGIFYGYLSDGIFGTDDDIAGSAQPTAKPGDIRFKDLNDSGGIEDNDRVVLGSAQPDFFGGITNTFSFKNFDLSVFMTFSYGNEIYNGTKSEMESLDGSRNQFKTVLNRWSESNQNTNIPRAVNVKLTSRSWDHLVEDGSYLRIQNINLGYNIPPRVLSGTKLVRSLKLSVSLQNFFTFTNYSGLDPEVSRYGQNNVGAGYDYGAYPTAKTVLFGINANF